MFENTQPEPSSGSTKLIGAVIGVALVLMLGFYFLFLRGEQGATPSAAAPAPSAAAAVDEEANPRRDLSILRSNLGRDQTGTMAMWDIQLANRSRAFTYRGIQYETNYYDAQGGLLQQGSGTLSDELTPGDQKTISGLNDGLYPVGTASYTIEIKEAEAIPR